MRSQTVVQHSSTDRKGVVVTDSFGVCGDLEVPVVFEGENVFLGMSISELKIIGPENAKATLEKCGAGKGAACCIFLIMGANGPECVRFGGLRWQIISRKEFMNAQREPTELYPNCQL